MEIVSELVSAMIMMAGLQGGLFSEETSFGWCLSDSGPGTASPRIFSRRSHALERDLLGLGSTGV